MPYDTKRRRVGIDVDDVLADFVTAHANLAREMFGKPTIGVLPIDWEMTNYGLTAAEHSAVWKKIQNTKNWWLTLGKKAGTTSLPEVCKHNLVYFITSRVPTVGSPFETQTAKWIHQNFGVEYPAVIPTNGMSKGAIAAALGLHAFIDDRVENCEDVLAKYPKCHVFIASRSHNLTFQHPEITRVADFNAFAEFL